MKYLIDNVFDDYLKITSNSDLNHNTLFSDKLVKNAFMELVDKNLNNYILTKNTASLFNVILADKRILTSQRHIMLSKLETIDIESSKNDHFQPSEYPHKISFDELSVGAVFLWCDMLHVYIGPCLAAEVKSDLSEALCIYVFNEHCNDNTPATEIIKIGECDPIKIKNIAEQFSQTH